MAGKFILIFAIVFLTNSPAIAQMPLRGIKPKANRVLLHKNGTLMRGELRRQDEYYYLKTHEGSECGFRVKDVQFIGDSIRSAYEYQWRNLPPRNVVANQNLAAWCLKYQLYREAKQQLDFAEKLRPGSQRTAALQRRLEYMLEESAKKSARVAQRIKNSTLKNKSTTLPIASKPIAKTKDVKLQKTVQGKQEAKQNRDPFDPDDFNRKYFPKRFEKK